MTGDSYIQCSDCNKPFLFSASRRRHYEFMGYHDPKRCEECRARRRAWKKKIGVLSGGQAK